MATALEQAFRTKAAQQWEQELTAADVACVEVATGPPEEVVPCLKSMHEQGKGILGMKILGEGTFKTEEQQLASLRFVLGLGCVDAMVIGFESQQQIDQIMSRVEKVLQEA